MGSNKSETNLGKMMKCLGLYLISKNALVDINFGFFLFEEIFFILTILFNFNNQLLVCDNIV